MVRCDDSPRCPRSSALCHICLQLIVRYINVHLIIRSRQRVDFKLAVLIFRCLHGLAPGYLSDDIRRVADTNRRRLRSSSSDLLTVRSTRLVTMGDRAFPVAGSRLWNFWNSLPYDVTSAPTLPVFCSRLKHICSSSRFPPIRLLLYSGLAVFTNIRPL